MSHIVILSSIYLGRASTNGLCAHNLVEALSKMGHDVDVICYRDTDNNSINTNSVYTIDSHNVTSKNTLYSVLTKIEKLFLWIQSSPRCFLIQDKVDKYYEKLMDINNKSKIDAVIAMFFPLETLESLCKFKSIIPDIKAIVYELDSISDGVAKSNFIHKILDKSYKKWISSTYEVVDDIIVMQSHSAFWQNVFGNRFRLKQHVSDIPVLLSQDRYIMTNTKFSFIYAGLIEKKYRSPEYLLSVFNELSKEISFSFAFYSKGDCEDIISTAAKKIKGIQQMGYVTKKELDCAINNSSFLVSIGNSTSNSVPSKLITYISYKKPIIHFSSQADDVCNYYLNKYPLSLIIHQNQSIKESSNQILSFIERINNKSFISMNIDVEELFMMNTPKFSATLIDSILR